MRGCLLDQATQRREDERQLEGRSEGKPQSGAEVSGEPKRAVQKAGELLGAIAGR